MRILLLSYDEYPPDPNTGGIGTYTRNLAHGLVDLGHEVHVVIKDMPTDFSADIEKGIRIHRCGKDAHDKYSDFVSRHGLSKTHGVLRVGFKILERYGFPGAALRLKRALTISKKVQEIINEGKIDVFEMAECGAQGFFIRKYFQSAVGVVKFHTPLYLVNYYNEDAASATVDSRSITYLEKRVVNRADLCTSPSKCMAEEASRLYKLRREVRVVPNGINIGEVDNIPAVNIRDQYGLSPDQRTVLYVGSTQPRKVNIFLQAVPKVLAADKSAAFIFAGRDDYGFEARLREALAAKDLPNNVIFAGKQPYNRVIGLLKSADIFVHPPIFENFPYTCMEAMTCRRAIVSTRVGGIPEMIPDGECGLLVKPNDGEKLAEAILTLLESRELRDRLGEDARRRVEELYDHRMIAEKTLKLYERCR